MLNCNVDDNNTFRKRQAACIVLQKTVRGYLTRCKLSEAKEIYNSIFSEVENDSDGFQPSGVPATTVDGTMFRKPGCYQGLTEETEKFCDRVRSYSSGVKERLRAKTLRKPTAHANLIPNVLCDWPRARSRTQHCSHSSGTSDPAGNELSPVVATALSQLPGQTKLSESCVPTVGGAPGSSVVTDATGQTIADAAVQTDTLLMTSLPVGTGDGEGALLTVGTDSQSARGGESEADEGHSLSNSPHSKSSVGRTSTSTNTPPQIREEGDNHLDLTAVTPLPAHSQLEVLLPTHSEAEGPLPAHNQSKISETFQPDNNNSSTPVSTLASRHRRQVVSDTKAGEAGTEQTSLWAQATLPSNNVSSDATEEELKAMKENMSMELLWIEQAIASRKQYLSLVKSMADDKQVTES